MPFWKILLTLFFRAPLSFKRLQEDLRLTARSGKALVAACGDGGDGGVEETRAAGIDEVGVVVKDDDDADGCGGGPGGSGFASLPISAEVDLRVVDVLVTIVIGSAFSSSSSSPELKSKVSILP